MLPFWVSFVVYKHSNSHSKPYGIVLHRKHTVLREVEIELFCMLPLQTLFFHKVLYTRWKFIDVKRQEMKINNKELRWKQGPFFFIIGLHHMKNILKEIVNEWFFCITFLWILLERVYIHIIDRVETEEYSANGSLLRTVDSPWESWMEKRKVPIYRWSYRRVQVLVRTWWGWSLYTFGGQIFSLFEREQQWKQRKINVKRGIDEFLREWLIVL